MARAVNPVPQILDDAGKPFVDAELFTFESGTSTLKDTFSDVNQTIANTNPVLISADGRWPNIFFTGIAKQKMTATVNEVPDQQIWERDPVGDSSPNDSISNWSALIIYNINDLVEGTDKAFYKSFTDGNINNDPTTSPAFWEEFKLITVWNPNVTYVLSANVIGSDGLTYRSLISSNTNNDPTSSPTEWGPTTSPIGTADIQDGAVTLVKLNADAYINRNFAINGGMFFWQRGTVHVLANTDEFTADRWFFGQGSGDPWNTVISQQSDGLDKVMRFQRQASQTGLTVTAISYNMESADFAEMMTTGDTEVTISFDLEAGNNYSPTGSILRTNIREGGGIDETLLPLGAFATSPILTQNNITISTTRTRFSVTFTPAGTTSQLGFQFWMTPTGTAGANDYYQLTNFKIEAGGVATKFNRAEDTLSGELSACQRYFVDFFGDVRAHSIASTGANADLRGANYMLPSEMRAAPTATGTASIGTISFPAIGNQSVYAQTDASDTTSTVFFSAVEFDAEL